MAFITLFLLINIGFVVGVIMLFINILMYSFEDITLI